MNIYLIIPVLLVVSGAMLSLLLMIRERSRQSQFANSVAVPNYQTDSRREGEAKSGKVPKVLIGFVIVSAVYAAIVVFQYWKNIIENKDTLIYAGGLFLFMVAGMFVRVISLNYKGRKKLFAVRGHALMYPLLFAPVVYYPVWGLAASSPRNLFVLYAAFLNGFFWESVVSSARRPEN